MKHAEGGISLAAPAVAGTRQGQLPAEGMLGRNGLQESSKAGPGWLPVAQVGQDLLPVSRENLTDTVVDTGTPGEPTQLQREGAQPPTESGREPHVDMIRDSGDNCDGKCWPAFHPLTLKVKAYRES